MKNKKLRVFLSGLLVVALIAGIAAFTVLADDDVATVTYDYNGGTPEFKFSNVTPYGDGHGHVYPNLFTDLQELMPGDSVTQEIKVKTTGYSTGHVNMKLRAEAHDNISAEELADYEKLINTDGVTLEVKRGNDVLGEADLAAGVSLGAMAANSELELTVSLNIDITVGNELQGLKAAVGWVFIAEYVPGSGTGPVNPPGEGEKDIDDNETPLDPILETEEHYSYIIGREDGLIHPQKEITRAEVATIFFRLLTDESRAEYWSQTNEFSDVAVNAWYNNAVSTLTNSGIINGRPDGTFDPNASITRAEFAALAVRFFGGEYEGEDHFTDISGHWANSEINRSAERRLVNGYEDGTFRPNNSITRAEAITIVNRVLGRMPHEDFLHEDMKTWEDNPEGTWYYLAIQEATNYHDYEFDGDEESGDTYEVWLKILEPRDWTSLEKQWSKSNSGATETTSSSENSSFEE